VGVAVADDAGEKYCRDVERAERERVAPVLGIGQGLVGQEEREDDVVDEDRDACQDVERHDRGEGVAQAPQM